MSRFAVPRLAAALVVVFGCSLALAQGTAPAPKAGAKEGKTRSLGGTGAGGGPILSRAELRDCLERQDAIAKARADIEAERVRLEAERRDVAAEQDALKAERAKLDGSSAAAASMAERYAALKQRADAWREREQQAAERTGQAGERMRREQEQERLELQKQQAALDAERAQLTAGTEQSVEAFNARVTQADARARGWNERNNALADRAEQLNADRDLWSGECANRRYREDDEILLRKGAK